MYIDNKLVFLAGATGSVGSAIMQYILDNHPTTRIHAAYRQTKPFIEHERVEYVNGDLRSQGDCRRMVKGCDCVIMAASNSAGSKLMTSQPWKYLNDNIQMNIQMLEAFYSENIKRIISIGTAAVYQEFDGYIKENELDMNEDPHSAYLGVAWIARFIEKMCQFWHEKTGMEIINVRAANIFGPYARFDLFNIGSGMKTTVDDVVNWSLKYAVHTSAKVQYDVDKPTTIKSRALDISKAKTVLGWQPQYTTEDGIKKTVEWWMENKARWNK